MPTKVNIKMLDEIICDYISEMPGADNILNKDIFKCSDKIIAELINNRFIEADK